MTNVISSFQKFIVSPLKKKSTIIFNTTFSKVYCNMGNLKISNVNVKVYILSSSTIHKNYNYDSPNNLPFYTFTKKERRCQ